MDDYTKGKGEMKARDSLLAKTSDVELVFGAIRGGSTGVFALTADSIIWHKPAGMLGRAEDVSYRRAAVTAVSHGMKGIKYLLSFSGQGFAEEVQLGKAAKHADAIAAALNS